MINIKKKTTEEVGRNCHKVDMREFVVAYSVFDGSRYTIATGSPRQNMLVFFSFLLFDMRTMSLNVDVLTWYVYVYFFYPNHLSTYYSLIILPHFFFFLFTFASLFFYYFPFFFRSFDFIYHVFVEMWRHRKWGEIIESSLTQLFNRVSFRYIDVYMRKIYFSSIFLFFLDSILSSVFLIV